MKLSFWLMLPLFFLLIISCEKDNEYENKEFEIGLIGFWKLDGYENDTVQVFKRTSSLTQNNYGFGFEEEGVFKENKNVGWCATPPISYGIYEGTWNMLSDSRIRVDVPYWGGDSYYVWNVISLTKTTLKIDLVDQDYQMD